MIEKQRRFEMVTTEDSLREMCRLIFSVGVVSVDTETTGLDPLTSRLRLIQLCVETEGALHCFVIDTWQWIKWRLEPLALIFANEDVLKIAHNAKFEVKFLTHHLLNPLEAGRCHTFFCTQLASTLASAANIAHHHGLADVAQRYLGITLDKTQQKSDWGAEVLTPEQIEYAANDVYVLGALHRALCQLLIEQDLWRVARIEMDAIAAIADAELAGLPVDREMWTALLKEKEARRDALREEVVAMLQPGVDWKDRNPARVGTRPVKPKRDFKKPVKKDLAPDDYVRALHEYETAKQHFENVVMAEWQQRFNAWDALPDEVVPVINLNSPSQVKLALVNIGVPLGTRKTNEKELLDVINNVSQELHGLRKSHEAAAREEAAAHDDEISALSRQVVRLADRIAKLEAALNVINKLLDYRGAEKSVTSYGQNILDLLTPEGRLHPDFNQIGAIDTGRMSCRDPNVQQIPHDEAHRSCVRPKPGRVFCIADYAQIELRIMAQLGGCNNFVSDFNSGLDMHTLGASRFTGIAYEKITKDQRQDAKAQNFLTIYGGGKYTLANRLGIPVDEAEVKLNAYFRAYPGNKLFMDRASDQAMKRGFARTMAGRLTRFDIQRAKFEDNWAMLKAFGRNGINMPIQGSSADMLKRAIYLLGNRLAGTTSHTVNYVHDEIVVECDDTPEAIAFTSAALKESMEAAGREFLTLVDCPVDVVVADRWVKG